MEPFTMNTRYLGLAAPIASGMRYCWREGGDATPLTRIRWWSRWPVLEQAWAVKAALDSAETVLIPMTRLGEERSG